MARLAAVFACAAAVAATANQDLWPEPTVLRAAATDVKLGFLSATLGDHMVLQQAPHFSVVWGHTTPGATVTTTFNGEKYKALAGSDGTWRQRLPPTPGSTKPYTLAFSSTSGETAELNDVLFGEVYICGGQSNMQFTIGAAPDAAEASKVADEYPHIRLFTVGQNTTSATPLKDLQTIQQPWAVASAENLVGPGWSYFSAVCWYFGKTISDRLSPNKELPIGLISNNWGGTKIQQWSSADVLKACNSTPTSSDGNLYNAMIHPYTVGPMVVSGFTWYQGESNVGDDRGASEYACLFPQMISSWRGRFRNPFAYFGFVQLSTWCGNPEQIAETREAQMVALELPKVGYATNADHGAGCDIHPKQKRFVGERLGNSALAVRYELPVDWRSPTLAAVTPVEAPAGTVAVSVALQDVGDEGLTALPQAYNMVDGLDCADLETKAQGTCAWAGIEVAGAGWLNATASVGPDGRQMLLQAELPQGATGAEVLAVRYGWGAVPMLTIYDKATGLPVLPWRHELAPSAILV